jgi:hypothetical protein
MIRFLPLIAFGLLTACQTVPVATQPRDTCGAESWQGFLGAQVSERDVGFQRKPVERPA